MVDIKIFDGHGLDIDKNTERKVETTFFQEDFRRVPMADIGAIEVVSDRPGGTATPSWNTSTARTIGERGRESWSTTDWVRRPPSCAPEAARLGDDQRQRRRRRPTRLRSPAQHEHDLRQLATICPRDRREPRRADGQRRWKTHRADRRSWRQHPAHVGAGRVRHSGLARPPRAAVAVPLTAPAMMERLAQDNGGPAGGCRQSAGPDARRRNASPIPAPAMPAVAAGAHRRRRGQLHLPGFSSGFDGMMAVTRCCSIGGLDDTLSVLADVPEYYSGLRRGAVSLGAQGAGNARPHERASRHSVDDGGQIDGVKFDFSSEWALCSPIRCGPSSTSTPSRLAGARDGPGREVHRTGEGRRA